MKQEIKANSNETQNFFLVSTRLRLLHVNAFRFATVLVCVFCVCMCDNACGPLCRWTLSDGVLTISGEGTMTKFRSQDDAPWHRDRGSIKKIVIEQGISSIGDYAFYQATRLLSIRIPSTVKTVGERAFYRCTSLTSGTVWLIDWNLCKETGEITFTGKGEMPPFPYSYDTSRHESAIGTPWHP